MFAYDLTSLVQRVTRAHHKVNVDVYAVRTLRPRTPVYLVLDKLNKLSLRFCSFDALQIPVTRQEKLRQVAHHFYEFIISF